MTLKEFIKTVKTAGDISGSLDDITYQLFLCTGLNFSENTIHAALHKKDKSPRYTQGSINESGFFRYFEERTSTTWPQMQKAFGELDDHGFINRDTENRSEFFESLLNLFYDILRLVPVSLCDILPQAPVIWGRQSEMEQLTRIFENNNYAFLAGIGGIGKSCMALAYAHSLRKSGHWTIQHMICENTDTVQTAINKLQFHGLSDTPEHKKDAVKKNFQSRITCLANSRRSVLIILDNLNRTFTLEDQDCFQKLSACGNHIRILITSRNMLSNEKRYSLNLSPLDDASLLALYTYHRFEDTADHEDYIAQHKEILVQMFSLVERHTLMVEFLAKLPGRIFVDECEIYNRLTSRLKIPLVEIKVKKDSKIVAVPAKGLIEVLFDISCLTDHEKLVMKYMSIMPATGIETKLFEKLTGRSRSEILSLIKANWIILDEERLTIRLHPLICEAVLSSNDTKPTAENCAEIIDRVKIERGAYEKGSSMWHIYNKILTCVASNIYYHEIESYGALDFLTDEYQSFLISMDQVMRKYINSDSIEKKGAPNALPEQNDADDAT